MIPVGIPLLTWTPAFFKLIKRVANDFLCEAQGHQNAYYILMIGNALSLASYVFIHFSSLIKTDCKQYDVQTLSFQMLINVQ